MYLKLAEASDKEAFVGMAKRFLAACPYRGLSVDTQKIEALLNDAVSDPLHGIIIFLMDEDKHVGMVFGKKFQPLFSSDWITTEVAWWVDPEYRNTRGSVNLIKAYEDWSLRVGADYVAMAQLPGFSPDGVDRLYTKMGYSPVETTYLKEI